MNTKQRFLDILALLNIYGHSISLEHFWTFCLSWTFLDILTLLNIFGHSGSLEQFWTFDGSLEQFWTFCFSWTFLDILALLNIFYFVLNSKIRVICAFQDWFLKTFKEKVLRFVFLWKLICKDLKEFFY